MEITRKDVSKPIVPIYEYTVVLTQEEAEELRKTLGKTQGAYRIFSGINDALRGKL